MGRGRLWLLAGTAKEPATVGECVYMCGVTGQEKGCVIVNACPRPCWATLLGADKKHMTALGRSL